MMIKYRTFYQLAALIAICAGLTMFGGCFSDSSPLGEESETDDPQTLTLTEQERADLAQDYLFAKHTKEERKRILHTVGSLTPEHSALFFDHLRDLQLDFAEKNGIAIDEDTKVMLEMNKAVRDFALKQGTNRLRLTKEGFNEALAEYLRDNTQVY
ncbi:MAG: hypothetical protein ABIO72_03350 [Patescibacteria group bacterium]